MTTHELAKELLEKEDTKVVLADFITGQSEALHLNNIIDTISSDGQELTVFVTNAAD